MASNFRRTLQQHARNGFTIVELLVVIVVIAILATISITAYNGVTRNAHEAGVKSDVRQAASTLKNYDTINSAYPVDCSGVNLSASEENSLTCAATSAQFCVTVSYDDITYYATHEVLAPIPGTCSGITGVPESSVFTQIAAGMGVTCGIASGKAYCWGDNWVGQLGIGSLSPASSSTPVAVDDSGVLAGKTVTDISVGDSHVCVVADGDVFCWGEGERGALGQNSTADAYSPVAMDMTGVLAGRTATRVAAGGDQTCVVADGDAFCTGDSYGGALGNGVSSGADYLLPVAVENTGVLAGKTVTEITIAGYYGYNACVIADGEAFCWGENGWGELGNGDSTTDSSVPVAVSTAGVLNGKTVTQISAYEYHVCATADGEAFCWGGNGNGYLGNNSNTNSNVPVAVSTAGILGGKTVTATVSGDYHSCGIADSKAYCWGNGTQGQLGNGVLSDSYVPVAVNDSGVLSGKTVTDISAGYNHTCAIADSVVHCWGDTVNWWADALGHGTGVGSSTPVLVSPLP